MTKKPRPWLYLFGTLLWTWTFLGLASVTGQFWLAFPTAILALIGGLGPAIVACILISLKQWDPELDTSAVGFLARCIDPRTLSRDWICKILALIILMTFLPVLWDFIAGEGDRLIAVGPPAFLMVGIIFGALEEIGWRGYGQEALQRELPIVLSGLIIGIFWALWHLPLFFIEGTYQHGLGIGTAAFWAFHAAILITSPLYAWLYNAAGRAVLAPLLYHGFGNLALELVPAVPNATSLTVSALVTITVTIASWNWMKQKRTHLRTF